MAPANPSKRIFIGMVTVLVLLLSTIVLWSIQAYRRSGNAIREIGLQGVILLLVLIFMIPVLKSSWDNIRVGLPLKDERSKKITVLAGYYAFLVSIYLWLGIMSFEKYFTVNSAAAAAILGSAVTFGVAYIILNRRPKLD